MFRYTLYISIYLIAVNCMLDHGSFDMRVTQHITCKGPKRRNCTKSIVSLENQAILKFDTHVFEDMQVVRGKISGILNKKELLKIQLKNICDHIFFKPLFMMFLNETERCGIFKGHYEFTVDIPTISQKFYGNNFIYGNWTYYSSFYTDVCNMHCEYVYVSILPKKL